MNEGKSKRNILVLVGGGGIAAGISVFSVPLLLGMGWTFSFALSLTTVAGLFLVGGIVMYAFNL